MKPVRLRFILVILLFSPLSSWAQDDGESEISTFIEGLSPIILSQGGVEVSNSSALISYWNRLRLINLSGGLITNTYRLSLFQNRTSVHYGFSQNGRWDLGAEIIYARRRWDDLSRRSPFNIFSGDDINKSGLSYVGVKARWQPLANAPRLTLQSTFRIPMANGDQLRRDLGAASMQISLFSTYYTTINYNTSFLVQGGWTYTFPKSLDETNTEIRPNSALSAGGFVAINLWGQRLYAVPGLSYSGNFRKSAKSNRILQLSHAVLGEFILQLQMGGGLSLTLQQSYPLLFESYSPTVDFERRSFSLSSVGLRLSI